MLPGTRSPRWGWCAGSRWPAWMRPPGGRARRAALRIGALDESGQEKKGEATAGVKRQHMGCAGGVENGIMAALAICAVTAALLRDRTDTQAPPPVRPDQRPPPDPGMIPLTVPEVKRLLAAALARPSPPGHTDHWSGWTRRHQARSRWFHQRTRLARDAEIALVS